MSEEKSYFSNEYTESSLKESIEKDLQIITVEDEKYGLSRPVRKIIHAKIINDESD